MFMAHTLFSLLHRGTTKQTARPPMNPPITSPHSLNLTEEQKKITRKFGSLKCGVTCAAEKVAKMGMGLVRVRVRVRVRVGVRVRVRVKVRVGVEVRVRVKVKVSVRVSVRVRVRVGARMRVRDGIRVRVRCSSSVQLQYDSYFSHC